jgi:hypothetical protein
VYNKYCVQVLCVGVGGGSFSQVSFCIFAYRTSLSSLFFAVKHNSPLTCNVYPQRFLLFYKYPTVCQVTMIRKLNGDFWRFFCKKYFIQHCYRCPSETGDAKIEAWTVASLALAVKHSTHSARSHPLSARSHPHSARSHPHSTRSHPNSARSHPHLTRSHPHSARSHPSSTRYHPQLG